MEPPWSLRSGLRDRVDWRSTRRTGETPGACFPNVASLRRGLTLGPGVAIEAHAARLPNEAQPRRGPHASSQNTCSVDLAVISAGLGPPIIADERLPHPPWRVGVASSCSAVLASFQLMRKIESSPVRPLGLPRAATNGGRLPWGFLPFDACGKGAATHAGLAEPGYAASPGFFDLLTLSSAPILSGRVSCR